MLVDKPILFGFYLLSLGCFVLFSPHTEFSHSLAASVWEILTNSQQDAKGKQSGCDSMAMKRAHQREKEEDSKCSLLSEWPTWSPLSEFDFITVCYMIVKQAHILLQSNFFFLLILHIGEDRKYGYNPGIYPTHTWVLLSCLEQMSCFLSKDVCLRDMVSKLFFTKQVKSTNEKLLKAVGY